jgi:hypothetical protein
VAFWSRGQLIYVNANGGMPPCGASSYVSFHETDDKVEMYWKLGEQEAEHHEVLTKSDTSYITLNTAYEEHAILRHIVRQLVLGMTWVRLRDSKAKSYLNPDLGIEPWVWPFEVFYEHYIAGCYNPRGTQLLRGNAANAVTPLQDSSFSAQRPSQDWLMGRYDQLVKLIPRK